MGKVQLHILQANTVLSVVLGVGQSLKIQAEQNLTGCETRSYKIEAVLTWCLRAILSRFSRRFR